jgi:beta-lactamase superfamily II metal-dependent hydrolase
MPPPNATSEPTMQPPESGITVRMYDTGFGDCLLLAFRARDNTPRYMLIDCGVHHQYPDGEERMRLVARDIAKATANHVNIVVVTHEHTDHLYGFKHARDIFEEIIMDELWLAWTEDETNPVAQQLKQVYGMRIKALTAAVNQLALAKQTLAYPLQRLLNFEFPDSLSATGGKTAQLDYLREKSLKKLRRPKDYRHPGEASLPITDVDGVKVYVLGPPENIKWIKKLTKESEMYPELTAMNETAAFTAAVFAAAGTEHLEDEERELFKVSCPFDESLEISKESALKHHENQIRHFFRRFYGFSRRKGHGPEWRRIDADWLLAAELLALDINAKTNNTSLVLAIELTETEPRKVILFAADAQVGNWLSWHELEWHEEGGEDQAVTVKDLLERTVLYKVGHHGSRNATLRGKGLEMMESDDLVAMIPVDENWANNKMHWEHPADNLLEALTQKTRGRIIRTDEIPKGNKSLKMSDKSTEDEWKAFLKQLDWDRSNERLWIQYTVPGAINV